MDRLTVWKYLADIAMTIWQRESGRRRELARHVWFKILCLVAYETGDQYDEPWL